MLAAIDRYASFLLCCFIYGYISPVFSVINQLVIIYFLPAGLFSINFPARGVTSKSTGCKRKGMDISIPVLA